MSQKGDQTKSAGPGNEVRDNDEKKVNSHRRKGRGKNNRNTNESEPRGKNYLLFPPSNVNPGNIGQWKRNITADLKEKAHKLACFTETGMKYSRPKPKLVLVDEKSDGENKLSEKNVKNNSSDGL